MNKFLLCIGLGLGLLFSQYIGANFSTISVAYAETVVFNTTTYKVHKIYCPYAKKCTVNCIKIDSKDAYKRGGVSCKKCGG